MLGLVPDYKHLWRVQFCQEILIYHQFSSTGHGDTQICQCVKVLVHGKSRESLRSEKSDINSHVKCLAGTLHSEGCEGFNTLHKFNLKQNVGLCSFSAVPKLDKSKVDVIFNETIAKCPPLNPMSYLRLLEGISI